MDVLTSVGPSLRWLGPGPSDHLDLFHLCNALCCRQVVSPVFAHDAPEPAPRLRPWYTRGATGALWYEWEILPVYLAAAVVVVWIFFSVGLSLWAMKNAGEPPMVECFDCDRTTCCGCPSLEKARYEPEDEQALAA